MRGHHLCLLLSLWCLLLPGAPAWAAEKVPLPREASAWVPGLIAALEDPNDEVASEALRWLEDSEKEHLPPELLTALRGYFQGPRWVGLAISEDKRIRWRIRVALRLLDEVPAEQLPRLMAVGEDSKRSEMVRASALEAVGGMGRAAWPERVRLMALLKEERGEPGVRIEAAHTLGVMDEGARDQVEPLGALLSDVQVDAVLRLEVTRALGRMKHLAPLVAPHLVARLEDPREDRVRRIAAAESLGRLGRATPAHARLLREWMEDPLEELHVQYLALHGLGQMGEAARGEVPHLMTLLQQTTNVDLRSQVARTLGALGPVCREQTGPLLALLRQEPGNQPVLAALDGLLDELTPEQHDLLGEMLGDSSLTPNTRLAVAGLLLKLGPAAAGQAPRLGALALRLREDVWDILLPSIVDVLGAMGASARAQAPLLGSLLSHEDNYVRLAAVHALERLGPSREVRAEAERLRERWRDPQERRDIRAAAASAWVSLGGKSDELTELGLQLLSSEQSQEGETVQDEQTINQHLVEVLAWMAPLSESQLARVLAFAGTDPGHRARWLMRAHLLGAGVPSTETLLRWTMRPEGEGLHTQLSLDEAVRTLAVFEPFWPHTEQAPLVRQDLARRIAQVVELTEGRWTRDQRELLERHERNLKRAGAPEARTLRAALNGMKSWLPAWSLLGAVALHLGVWLSLLFLYPRSPQVQALFFWDSRVRKVLGCGYVDALLTWVPFLRRRLLAPFQHLLLADADLERFSPGAYFPDAEVLDTATGKRESLLQVLPRLRGQVILQGASGLGKSMFIRHLLRESTRLAVFLPATRCDRGVLEAIQAKLEGHASGAGLLQKLVFSGALDIYLDGLNEATADTRAHISRFVEHNFHGNILVTTQRMEWTPPRTARLYEILPLSDAQTTAFLVSREPHLDAQAPLRGAAWREACERFVARVLSPDEPEELRQAMREVLSNPMDLSVVAQMLARRLTPDLFHLHQQQYELMARDYHDVNVAPFPLKDFSEEAYRMRLEDRAAVPEERFGKELLRMEDFKLVVRRQWKAPDGQEHREWRFRHDKLHEFFIAQSFLGPDNPRLVEHMGDPRFRGVYFLLAVLLEPEPATRLRDQLVEHAARTRDHTVSDDFVLLLQGRREAEKARGARRKGKGATGS